MAIGPTIETDRLILRPPRAEDFDSWVAFHADEAVMAHLGGVQGVVLAVNLEHWFQAPDYPGAG